MDSPLSALTFFALFNHPLTLGEVDRSQYCDGRDLYTSLYDCHRNLEQSIDHGFVRERFGFFGINKERSAEARRFCRRRVDKNIARALAVSRWLRFIPTVRLIALCNGLAFGRASEKSDIDLFIVTSPRALWITRLLVVGILTAMRSRPTAHTAAQKLCASFFVSEEAMNIGVFRIASGDTYLHFWVAALLPLYDAGGVFEKFWTANRWVQERLPRSLPKHSAPARRLNLLPKFFERVIPFLSRFEVIARRVQERTFPNTIRSKINRDSRVVATDTTLKFHTNDRRAMFESQFRSRLRDYVTAP